jgi:hypothetical protein
MMTLIKEIQRDIVTDVPVSSILRKVKVLAYDLNSPDLNDWVEKELSGYDNESDLPKYRKLTGVPVGTFTNGFRTISGQAIPLFNIPEWMRKWGDVPIYAGAGEIEALAKLQEAAQHKGDGKPMSVLWPGDFLPYLNGQVIQDYNCLSAQTIVPLGAHEGVLNAIRDKLLAFVLELERRYPKLELAGFDAQNPAIGEGVRKLVQNNFYGGSQNVSTLGDGTVLGGTMTTFNQQNQQVSGTQNNAGRDINFSTVQSKEELVVGLEQLRAAIETALERGEIDEEPGANASNEVRKAIQKTKKEDPDKEGILDHLKNATTILKGVATAALLPLLQQATEAVLKVFGG